MVLKDIIDLVHEDIDGTVKKSDLESAFRSFLKISREQLLITESIVLTNFGTISLEKRNARKARNPRTGEQVNVPDRKVAKFHPSKVLAKGIKGLR